MEEEAGESGNKSVGEPLPVESIGQVFPVRVGAFDQGDLPGAPPAFQGPLAGEGVPDRAEGFDMDEAGDGVAAGEALGNAFAMLPDAPGEIAGGTDIERAVGGARQDVNVELPWHGRMVVWRGEKCPGKCERSRTEKCLPGPRG